MNKINLDRVWDDARAMGAANRDLIAAIAGMFVMLPNAVAPLLIKAPEKVPADLPREKLLELQMHLYTDNWATLLGTSVVTAFGTLAMLALLLRTDRLTVAESLKAALLALPGYYVASLLSSFAGGVGIVLLVLPGIYILARLALLGAVAAAEQRFNPVELLQRSFALTRGNGWRIVLLFAIFLATAGVVWLVVNTVTGMVADLLLPKDIALLVTSIVSALVSAAFTAMSALLLAALYRAAADTASAPWVPHG